MGNSVTKRGFPITYKIVFVQSLKPNLLPPNIYTKVKTYHPNFTIRHNINSQKIDLSNVTEIRYITEYNKSYYQIYDGKINHIFEISSDSIKDEKTVRFLMDFSILMQLQHFDNNNDIVM